MEGQSYDQTLTPIDLARRWGVSTRTLANARSEGKGPAYIKPMGRIVYRLADVLAYESAASVMASA